MNLIRTHDLHFNNFWQQFPGLTGLGGMNLLACQGQRVVIAVARSTDDAGLRREQSVIDRVGSCVELKFGNTEAEMMECIADAHGLLLISGDCVHVDEGGTQGIEGGLVAQRLTKLLLAAPALKWIATWGHGS